MASMEREPSCHEEIERLRAELARREREAADKERQLERYAADLRETFKQERARPGAARSYMATVRALSNAVEARDAYTGKHAERVTAYGMEIARGVRTLRSPNTPRSSSASCCTTSARSRSPTRSSTSPAALTDEERALMAQHPVIGAEIVRGIEFLGEAVPVVRSHHERWDGGGYPDGLARRGDPAAGAAVRRRRRARRADHRPALPARAAAARGARDDPGRSRSALRPGGGRGVRLDRRRDARARSQSEIR